MIFNISHRNRKLDREIAEHIGKPYGWLERIKMKGSGSQRFVVQQADRGILDKIGNIQGLMYCNIELRPEGLMVYFRSRIETYALVVPYYQLVIYKNGHTLSIYTGQHKLTLLPSNGASLDREFYRKMMDLKHIYPNPEEHSDTRRCNGKNCP